MFLRSAASNCSQAPTFRTLCAVSRHIPVDDIDICIYIIHNAIKLHFPIKILILYKVFFLSANLNEVFTSSIDPELLLKVSAQLACGETEIIMAERYIRESIRPFSKKYDYPNEKHINPGYQDIASIQDSLCPDEKRIWVLRSDFILATGVKNAYEKEYGYCGFFNSFPSSLHKLIDRNDRYGHSSLTFVEGDYDGTAYYAGYLCQRDGFLQVYLVSGRFERRDLNARQTDILEAFIAAQFQAVYGLQDIVFDYGDSDDPRYHTAFFSGGFNGCGTVEGNPQRCYNRQTIQTILQSLKNDETNYKNDDYQP